MPAAPVTKTLIGSFSMLTKLHIYLMSFQKNPMVNETTRNFWRSSVSSIFSLNQKKRKTILADNQYKTRLPPPESEEETIIICRESKESADTTHPRHAKTSQYARQNHDGIQIPNTRIRIFHSFETLTKSTTKNENYSIQRCEADR